MTKSIFISYSRSNRYIARQLKLDLQRAGCAPWMDVSDIPPARRWRDEIRHAIENHDYFVLLWSPEADSSENVGKEYEHAKLHKPADRIWRLCVAKSGYDLREEYRERQDIDFTENYWEGLRETLRWLNVQEPEYLSPFDIIDSNLLMTKAREMFVDEDRRGWTIRSRRAVDSPPRKFIRMPLQPSGYAASWLVGEDQRSLRRQDDLQVVLKFTGTPNARDTVEQVLSYLVTTDIDPQILYVEGPQQDRKYELPNAKQHVWRDCIELSEAVIGRYCGNKPVRYFMDSPQALTFALAARFHLSRSFRVYNLNTNATDEDLYSCVYSD